MLNPHLLTISFLKHVICRVVVFSLASVRLCCGSHVLPLWFRPSCLPGSSLAVVHPSCLTCCCLKVAFSCQIGWQEIACSLLAPTSHLFGQCRGCYSSFMPLLFFFFWIHHMFFVNESNLKFQMLVALPFGLTSSSVIKNPYSSLFNNRTCEP